MVFAAPQCAVAQQEFWYIIFYQIVGISVATIFLLFSCSIFCGIYLWDENECHILLYCSRQTSGEALRLDLYVLYVGIFFFIHGFLSHPGCNIKKIKNCIFCTLLNNKILFDRFLNFRPRRYCTSIPVQEGAVATLVIYIFNLRCYLHHGHGDQRRLEYQQYFINPISCYLIIVPYDSCAIQELLEGY